MPPCVNNGFTISLNLIKGLGLEKVDFKTLVNTHAQIAGINILVS